MDLRNQNQLYLKQLDTAEKEAKKKQHQLEEVSETCSNEIYLQC